MRWFYVLLLTISLVACSSGAGDPVVRVTDDDEAMNEAIETARSSIPAFRAVVASPPPGSSGFAVKVAFAYGAEGAREHIWLTEPTFAADRVTGVVNNDPVDVENLRLGQKVTAPASEISDWMYIDNGVLKGGFTLRVLLGRMPENERSATLSSMGIRLE